MALLKILVVTALAPKHAHVRFDRAGESLAQRLAPYVRSGVVSVLVRHAVSLRRLTQLVAQHRPDVLHVYCHGEGEKRRVLVLEGRCGGSEVVDAEAFRAAVTDASDWAPELTVLAACRSRPIAEALVRPPGPGMALPRAIGMSEDVALEHATYFFETLYHLLASGLGLRRAFQEARRDLEIFAPEAAENPALLHSPAGAGDPKFALANAFVIRGIAAADLDERVFVHAALRGGDGFVGREEQLRRLERVLRGEPRILLVRGEAGIGITTLLSEALAKLARLGWPGSARVLAFSFGAASRWHGGERLAEFFAAGLELFGEHSAPATSERDEALWTLGRRLGRLVRHERALLVLDDVPTLPRGEDEVRSLEAFVHPALAAFLREVVTGGECRCVLSARSEAGGLQTEEGRVEELEVPGLAKSEGEALLVRSGMVDAPLALQGLSDRLGGHPLAIRLIARRYAAVSEAERALERVAPERGEVKLAVAAAALSDGMPPGLLGKLRRWAVAPQNVAHRDLVGEVTIDDQRSVLRAGLGELQEPSTLVIAHGALALDEDGEVLAVPAAVLDAVVEGPQVLDEMHAAGRAIAVCQLLRAWDAASALFVDKVTKRTPGKQAHSFVAEELAMLAGFFAPRVAGGVDWATVRAGVQPRHHADLLHRAGVALRNLGQLQRSTSVLARAIRTYSAEGRADAAGEAMTDLVLALLWLGDPDTAGNLMAVRDPRASWSARALAVRGRVLTSTKDEAGAREAFKDARAVAAREGHPLCGMAGFLEWSCALEQIERLAGDGDAAIDELAHRLDEARVHHQRATAERVAPGLEALARARLATFCAMRRRSLPRFQDASRGWNSPRKAGRREFATAFAVFGATQHLWMLPLAHEWWSMFRGEVLQDSTGTRVDKDTAADPEG